MPWQFWVRTLNHALNNRRTAAGTTDTIFIYKKRQNSYSEYPDGETKIKFKFSNAAVAPLHYLHH